MTKSLGLLTVVCLIGLYAVVTATLLTLGITFVSSGISSSNSGMTTGGVVSLCLSLVMMVLGGWLVRRYEMGMVTQDAQPVEV